MRIRKKIGIGLDQQGQAATEFIVAAVFVLVPLFLIIPLLGKYVDIRHAAIQQARFEAWEYSVWSGPSEYIMNDIQSDQSSGRLQYADARRKGMKIFFNDPNANSYLNPRAPFEVNPLWEDHRGNSLFTSSTIISSGQIKENKTPDSLKGVLDFILDAIQFVFKAFGTIMKFVHVDAEFDAIYAKGYYTSDVNIEVRSIDQVLPNESLSKITTDIIASPLEIKAKASVLTNAWNAGSTDNANAETRGIVFTAVLKPVTDTVNGVVTLINSLTSYIPLLKIQLPSMPDFGYVSDDLVPYDHIEGSKEYLHEKNGLYYYQK